MRRLSGRALVVPETTELVAVGAAAQAAGVLVDERPEVVARAWNTQHGAELEPVPRDEATLERHRDTRREVASLSTLTAERDDG